MKCDDIEVKSRIAKYRNDNPGLSDKDIAKVVKEDIGITDNKSSNLSGMEDKFAKFYNMVSSHPGGDKAGIAALLTTDTYKHIPGHENIQSRARFTAREGSREIPVELARSIESITGRNFLTSGKKKRLRDDLVREWFLGKDTGNKEAKEIAKSFTAAKDDMNSKAVAIGLPPINFTLGIRNLVPLETVKSKVVKKIAKLTHLSEEEIVVELKKVAKGELSRFETEDIFINTAAERKFIRRYADDPLTTIRKIIDIQSKAIAKFEVVGNDANFELALDIAFSKKQKDNYTSRGMLESTYRAVTNAEGYEVTNQNMLQASAKGLSAVTSGSSLAYAPFLSVTDLSLGSLESAKAQKGVLKALTAAATHIMVAVPLVGATKNIKRATELHVATDRDFGSISTRYGDDTDAGILGQTVDVIMRLLGLSVLSIKNKNRIAVSAAEGILDNIGSYKIGDDVPLILRRTGVPKETIERLSKLDVKDFTNWDREDIRIVTGMVDDTVARGQLEPDARTETILSAGLDRDSPEELGVKALSKFKAFPIQFYREHGGGLRKNVNMTKAEKFSEGAAVLATTIMAGIISSAIIDVMKNRTPEKGSPLYEKLGGEEKVTTEDTIKFWLKHSAVDGPFGFFLGPIYEWVYDRKFYTNPSSITMPSANIIAGVASMGYEGIKYATDDKVEDVQRINKSVIKLVDVIFPELPYTKPLQVEAVKHLMMKYAPREAMKMEKARNRRDAKEGRTHIFTIED